MDRQLTTAGLFAKWLLVPVALCGVGYFFIGPRIGGGYGKILPAAHHSAPPSKEPRLRPVTAVVATTHKPTLPPSNGPDVEVSVTRAGDQPGDPALATDAPRPRRHRRHRKSSDGTAIVRRSDTGPASGGGDTGGASNTGGTEGGTTGATTGTTTGGTEGGTTGGTDTGSTTGGR